MMMTYTPGPDKYNANNVLSAFSKEYIKEDSKYFLTWNNGKLTERT